MTMFFSGARVINVQQVKVEAGTKENDRNN
jgi:hypothetical protein